MNEKVLGAVLGIIFAIVVAVVATAGFIFYINYQQPEFICELCRASMNCTFDKIILNYP